MGHSIRWHAGGYCDGSDHCLPWGTLGVVGDAWHGSRLFAQFCFGGSASMLGSVGVFVASFIPGDRAGAWCPKQFASFVGTFFCLLERSCFMLGMAVTSLPLGRQLCWWTAGASFLEGFFNFCIGCVVFGFWWIWHCVGGRLPAIHRLTTLRQLQLTRVPQASGACSVWSGETVRRHKCCDSLRVAEAGSAICGRCSYRCGGAP